MMKHIVLKHVIGNNMCTQKCPWPSHHENSSHGVEIWKWIIKKNITPVDTYWVNDITSCMLWKQNGSSHRSGFKYFENYKKCIWILGKHKTWSDELSILVLWYKIRFLFGFVSPLMLQKPELQYTGAMKGLDGFS